MAREPITTIRLDREDAEALARAREDGQSPAELIRRGLRKVAAKYYRGKRPPSVGLFVASSRKLGDESELYEELER
jgi:Arc/MetJ-type ribon-helix-helix transcriptional regulator